MRNAGITATVRPSDVTIHTNDSHIAAQESHPPPELHPVSSPLHPRRKDSPLNCYTAAFSSSGSAPPALLCVLLQTMRKLLGGWWDAHVVDGGLCLGCSAPPRLALPENSEECGQRPFPQLAFLSAYDGWLRGVVAYLAVLVYGLSFVADTPTTNPIFSILYRSSLLVLSEVACVFIVLSHLTRYRIQALIDPPLFNPAHVMKQPREQRNDSLLPKASGLWTSPTVLCLLLEVLLWNILTPPYLPPLRVSGNGSYHSASGTRQLLLFLNNLLFFRLYAVLHYYAYRSLGHPGRPWTRAWTVLTRGGRFSLGGGTKFYLRTTLVYHWRRCVPLWVLFWWITLGLLFRKTRMDPDSRPSTVSDGLWLSFQTLSTLSYGDYPPVRAHTKWLMWMAWIGNIWLWSYCLLLLIWGFPDTHLSQSPMPSWTTGANHNMECLALCSALSQRRRCTAAEAIQAAWRLFAAQRRLHNRPSARHSGNVDGEQRGGVSSGGWCAVWRWTRYAVPVMARQWRLYFSLRRFSACHCAYLDQVERFVVCTPFTTTWCRDTTPSPPLVCPLCSTRWSSEGWEGEGAVRLLPYQCRCGGPRGTAASAHHRGGRRHRYLKPSPREVEERSLRCRSATIGGVGRHEGSIHGVWENRRDAGWQSTDSVETGVSGSLQPLSSATRRAIQVISPTGFSAAPPSRTQLERGLELVREAIQVHQATPTCGRAPPLDPSLVLSFEALSAQLLQGQQEREDSSLQSPMRQREQPPAGFSSVHSPLAPISSLHGNSDRVDRPHAEIPYRTLRSSHIQRGEGAADAPLGPMGSSASFQREEISQSFHCAPMAVSLTELQTQMCGLEAKYNELHHLVEEVLI